MSANSLFEKIWNTHIVSPEEDETPAIIYVDLHLIHEVTSPIAFNLLRRKDLKVRRPDLTLATIDHSIPTVPVASLKELEVICEPAAAKAVIQMEKNCADYDVPIYGLTSEQRGIVHVIGPELGATQPGKTIVCGDSHTSTHGALGALAFGIGTTEVAHVLTTQCLLQRRPKNCAVNLDGELQKGVTAKDIILAIIGKMGVDGGIGHVIEYRGTTVSQLSIDERMTICNMSIEAGARAGLMAPDDTTYEYLAGRPMAPAGTDWDDALVHWRRLSSDPDAVFDKTIGVNVSALTPMVTFGTNPGMVISIEQKIPAPAANDSAFAKALDYMRLKPGIPLLGQPVDVVFIGSCTNGRLSDLRSAAHLLDGRRVAENVRMLVVPGSQQVKRDAEAEGLHKVILAAGAEWREPGCSMCLGMNGDIVPRGKLAVSTSNRNFEGRQGVGARTVLASPLTATASAISGVISDPRELLN
ncbi:MAG: 3-isopropylmalate dehydratase large subunit [Gammaproteobacteria bacterium]